MILYILAYVLAIVVIGLLWYFFPREEYTMSTEAHTIMEGEVDKMFPVGTVLLTLYAENPSEKIEFLKGTTWKQIKSGYTLCTENITQNQGFSGTPTDTLGPFKTEGHAITKDEFPNHIHGVTVKNSDTDSHTHTFTFYHDDIVDKGGVIRTDHGHPFIGYSNVTTNDSSAEHHHTYSVDSNSSSSEEHYHDIILPYSTFHIWKRTY